MYSLVDYQSLDGVSAKDAAAPFLVSSSDHIHGGIDREHLAHGRRTKVSRSSRMNCGLLAAYLPNVDDYGTLITCTLPNC